MQVFVQRRDGLFLQTDSVWVSSKEDAKDFGNCTPAIDYCVAHEIKDVRLCMSFGDAKYDLFLDVFRYETRALPNRHQDLKSQHQGLVQELDRIRAGAKERKKQIPFMQKPPEGKSGPEPR